MSTAVRTSDAELLIRLRERERGAWEELYAEYQPRLRAFGYRLSGNVHDADDLVQETFVRAVPRLDRLDLATADVGAYLFATLRNLFLKQVERGNRQQPVAEVPEPATPPPIDDDPERSTLLRRQQDEVRVANGRLQPRQRLVLALRELEDRSYAEIGEIVGMKENAVAQLIFRARESLRTELRLAQVDPERLPDECRRFLPLLAAHLDGQLKGARRDATLAHLEDCERCQAALADMREASRRYRSLLPFLLESDEARAAVERRLDDAGYWTRSARRLARRSLAIAVAAAVAVLSGGGAAVGVALSRGDRPATAAPSLVVNTTTEAATEPTAPTTPDPAATGALPPTSPAKAPKKQPAPVAKQNNKVESTAKLNPEPKKPETKTEPGPDRDTAAPTVTITAAPPRDTATANAAIAFRANENGAVFSCKLDAAAHSACTSPVQLANLAAGAHTFSVRATDKAGNVGRDATVSWTYTPPDTTAPTVRIASAPAARTSDTSATFSFSADENGVTFRCSLDGGAERACSSPASYASLAVGSHTFAVRATDRSGNTGQPATYQWTVFELLPDLHVSAFGKYTIAVSNRGAATAGPSTLTITLIGTFSVPSLQPGASARFSWSICRVGTYSAIVDRTNAVRESDEANNTASLRNTCP
jgi:RNA polymerase sigma factor (sigma-70 family)